MNQLNWASWGSSLWLVLWMVLCFAVAGVSGGFTAREVRGWYRTLSRPSFAPPNWVFGPVWTLLYLMMAVAAWLIWMSPAAVSGAGKSLAITLFLVQLALNFAWSWLFFARHRIGWALIEIVVLWVAILATVLAFRGISPLAAGLLLPYLAWVTFATALNAGYWQSNRYS